MTHMSIEENDPDFSDHFNLANVVDTLLQYIWLVVGIFLAVMIAGALYVVLAAPIYRADVLIQVEEKKSAALGGLQDIADMLGGSANPVSGEIEILKSREILMKAIEATQADLKVRPRRVPIVGDWYARKYEGSGLAEPFLGLSTYAWGGESLKLKYFDVPERAQGEEFSFVVADDGSYEFLNSEGQLLGRGYVGREAEFGTNGGVVRVTVSQMQARPGAKFYVTQRPKIEVYKEILAKLNVTEAGRQSGIITLSYTSSQAEFAQSLVNSIAKYYLAQNIERRSAEADQSLKFLESQLPELKKELIRAEDALSDLKSKLSSVDVSKQAESLLQQAIDAEKSRTQLRLKRDELRQRYRAGHPELRAVELQLANLEKVSTAIDEQIGKLPLAQRDLLRKQRDVEVSGALYVALLNNAQQLRVAKAGTVGNVRVIDFAIKDSEPIAPNKSLIIIFCAIGGLLLGVGAVFVARMLRPTIREISEVERATGLTSFASIPESLSQEKLDSSKRDSRGKRLIVEGRSQLLSLIQPDDPAIESLRSLRTGLSFAMLGATNKNIVITSATPAVGKSFISANIAVLMAQAGKRVLLIETDMRRSQLGAYFGYGDRPGLSAYLIGQASLHDILIRGPGGVAELDVLPAGIVPPNPGELLLSDNFSRLLSEVQEKYDYIILDSAPVLPVGDTLAVARQAAVLFLVVRAEASTLGEVKDAIRKLEAAGSKAKGFIFNGIKRRRVGYGYAYRYYYSYGEK